MIFGNTLHLLRVTKGARQKRLALALGVDQSYVSLIEAGKKPPPKSPQFVERVAIELALTEPERIRLEAAWEAEARLGDLATDASSAQAQLGLAVLKNLTKLSDAKIDAISAILRL